MLRINIKKYFSTYYEILKVSNTADTNEIKTNFLKLVKEYHPDINKDNEEKFKEILKAYNTLKDNQQRKIYDLKLINPNVEIDYSINKDNIYEVNNKKFYENKYYNYKKPHDDLRFENFSERINYFVLEVKYKIIIIAIIYLLYEFYSYKYKQKYIKYLDFRKELQVSEESEAAKYINNRLKENITSK